MRARTSITLAALACAFPLPSAAAAHAAAGDLDSGFGVGGIVTTAGAQLGDATANASVLQSDGKLVVAGQARTEDERRFAVSRFAPDGSADPSFGKGGRVVIAVGPGGSRATAVAVQADGKIVVAGSAVTPAASGDLGFAAVRLSPNGAPDPSFGSDGRVVTPMSSEATASGLALQPDGRIVIAGTAGDRFALVRYTADGSLDSTFGSGGKVTSQVGGSGASSAANAVALQSDGKIVAAGTNWVEGGPTFALARYTTAGASDPTFGINGQVLTPAGRTANALAIQPDGRLVVGGEGDSQNGTGSAFVVARYLSTGVLDLSFGAQGTTSTDVDYVSAISALRIDALGRAVVAGNTGDGSHRWWAIARYTTSGSLDTTFGIGGTLTGNEVEREFTHAFAINLAVDGSVLVSGTSADGDGTHAATRRLTSSGQPDESYGQDGVATAEYERVSNSRTADAIAQADGKIVVAGTESDSSARPYDQRLLVARYLPDGGLDPGFGESGIVRRSGGHAAALLRRNDGTLVAATNSWGPGLRMALHGLRPDGSDDPAFGTGGVVEQGPAERGYAWVENLAAQGDGKVLVVGRVGDDAVVLRYLANGSLDPDFADAGRLVIAADSPASANSVAVQPDGRIVVAGDADSQPMVGRFNSDGSPDTSFAGDGVVVTPQPTWARLDDVVVKPDGGAIAAGAGSGEEVVLAYRADGSPDPSFGTGGRRVLKLGFANPVSLVVQPNGALFVATSTGYCCVSTSDSRVVFARLHADGSTDTAFGDAGRRYLRFAAGRSATVSGLARQVDGRLVVAGADWVGDQLGLASSRIAVARVEGVATPETRITSMPAAVSDEPAPRFEFDSPAARALFECRLDGATWEDCASPQNYDVDEGAHSFEVRAHDSEGTDPTPARYEWTVQFAEPAAPPGEARVRPNASTAPAAARDEWVDQRAVLAAPPASPRSEFPQLRVSVVGRRGYVLAAPWTARAVKGRLRSLALRGGDRLVVTPPTRLRSLQVELQTARYRRSSRGVAVRRIGRDALRWSVLVPRRLPANARFLVLRARTSTRSVQYGLALRRR